MQGGSIQIHSSPPWSPGMICVNELQNALCVHLPMTLCGFSVELHTVKGAVTT